MAEAQEAPEDSHQGYFLMPRELRAACAQAHKNTSQLVEFIAEQTLGWHARWVYLTYDEIRDGRKKANGERMGPGSFLTQDKTVRRAIIDALDKEQPLIEVRYFAWGTAYAIHKRFWRSSKVLPKWEFYGRTSYNAQDDPLEEDEQATVKKTAQPLQEETESIQEAKTPVKKTATDYQIDSTPLSNSQQETNKKAEEMARESAPQEAGHVPIDTSLDTFEIDTEDRYVKPSAEQHAAPPLSKTKREDTFTNAGANAAEEAPSLQASAPGDHLSTNAPAANREQARRPRPARAAYTWSDDRVSKQRQAPEESGTVELPAHDLDALQQRQVAQHALQKLLAEQEQLRVLLPSQRGWGAAQGRLRSIAREIERLQAEAASSAEPAAATGKAESTQLRRSPAAPPPQASAPPALSEQATRQQRLTKLQEELAQLKKTPSMRLLARRRIPRLEAEIKQLIAEMSPG